MSAETVNCPLQIVAKAALVGFGAGLAAGLGTWLYFSWRQRRENENGLTLPLGSGQIVLTPAAMRDVAVQALRDFPEVALKGIQVAYRHHGPELLLDVVTAPGRLEGSDILGIQERVLRELRRLTGLGEELNVSIKVRQYH